MRIKMQCFPGDDCSLTNISGWLDELICNGLLIRYQAGGESYLAVTGWERHQRIEKPTYKWPKPPSFGCANSTINPHSADYHTSTLCGRGADQSATPPRLVNDASPPERSGEERKGGRDSDGGNARVRDVPPEQAALIRVFDEARIAAYGSEQVRPTPAATDSETARRWLKAGAEAGIKQDDMFDLCAITISAVHLRLKAKGHEPPQTLSFHDRDIARALRARNTPMPKVEDYVQRTDCSRGAKRSAVDAMLAGFSAAANDRETG